LSCECNVRVAVVSRVGHASRFLPVVQDSPFQSLRGHDGHEFELTFLAILPGSLASCPERFLRMV
jgi:hypothetical protein